MGKPLPFSLSVVIPAYNETHRLSETLRVLRPYLSQAFRGYEIIVVDDGSTDGTPRLVQSLSTDWPELKLLVQPKNLGKGAAVKRGVLATTCDLVLFTDADLATPIEEIENMIPHFEESLNRAVVGVRTYQQDESKWRRILGLAAQIATHLIVFDRAVVDSQCGFKCFGRELAHNVFRLVRINGGMFDAEIFAIMYSMKVDVYYQPVHWANKPGSRINILRCMLFDIVDMCVIRKNLVLGHYNVVDEIGALAPKGDAT